MSHMQNLKRYSHTHMYVRTSINPMVHDMENLTFARNSVVVPRRHPRIVVRSLRRYSYTRVHTHTCLSTLVCMCARLPTPCVSSMIYIRKSWCLKVQLVVYPIYIYIYIHIPIYIYISTAYPLLMSVCLPTHTVYVQVYIQYSQ